MLVALLLLLTSLVVQPLLDAWVPLFCRPCVYTHSTVNAVVYGVMSQKFWEAFRRLCGCLGGVTEVRSLPHRHQLQCGPRDPPEDAGRQE